MATGFRFKLIALAAAAALGSGALFLGALATPVRDLFPGDGKTRVAAWDDRLETGDSLGEGGSSSRAFALDNKIVWRWRVAPGFEYPYAGFEAFLGDSSRAGADLSGCDSLYLGINSVSGGELLVEIRTFDRARTVPNDPNTRRLLQKRVEFAPGQSGLAVALADVRMPDWWRDEMKIPATDNEQFLSNVLSVGFQADEKLLGRSDTVEVLWITAAAANWRDRMVRVLAGMLLALAAIALLFAEQFARRRRTLALLRDRAVVSVADGARAAAADSPAGEPGLPARDGEPAGAPDAPEEAPAADEGGNAAPGPDAGPKAAADIDPSEGPAWPAEDFELIRAWMADHFTDPAAAPEAAAGDLGWSVSKLGRVVKAGSGQTFTAWLLDLRLRRAAAMLRGSSLPVAQIAYDCGFSTPAYFNRAFKERHGATPTEYRRSADAG